MAKPSNPDLARRILDLALEELGSKSPDKVNMRALAERAGVSPTAIYYYFASKDDLFERIKFDIMDELGARIAVATARGGSARDRLEALMRAYVAWCLDRPHLARLLMEDLPPKEELTEETTRKYYAVFFAARDLIEEAVEERGLSSRNAELDASMGQAALWGIVTQFRSKRVHPRFWDSIDPLIERFIELYFGDEGDSK